MNISDEIQDEIDRFKHQNPGRDPSVMKLGRRQIAALDAFVRKHDGGAVPYSERMGVPNYNGIRIKKEEVESSLSVE